MSEMAARQQKQACVPAPLPEVSGDLWKRKVARSSRNVSSNEMTSNARAASTRCLLAAAAFVSSAQAEKEVKAGVGPAPAFGAARLIWLRSSRSSDGGAWEVDPQGLAANPFKFQPLLMK